MDWNMMTCMDYAAKLCKIKYFTVGQNIDIEVIDYDSDINQPLWEDRVWIIYKRELYCERYKVPVVRFLEEIGQGAISIRIIHNNYLVQREKNFGSPITVQY